MKTKICSLLLLSFFIAVSAFSQFEYAQKVYSLSDMNVKGKVKRIIETEVSVDHKGRVDDDEEKHRIIYEFDESGKLIKKLGVEYDDPDDVESTLIYSYSNGKPSKLYEKVIFSEPDNYTFSYPSNGILVKDEDGDIKEKYTLTNNRITEIKYYTNSTTMYRHRELYEYNAAGQVTKETYMDDAETYRKYSSSQTYAYNKNGDRSRKEKFGDDKKLEWISDYDYSYDKNKNWTRCVEEFYSPGEKKEDRVYTRYERTYEYY